MTEGEKRCGLGSFLPMSCRGRAEAFARRLHNRLRSLGSQDGDTSSENSWLATSEDSSSVTSLQPRHSATENDIFMDFGLFDTPGSPGEEIVDTEITKFITNPKDDLHLLNLDECGCMSGNTSCNIVKRNSLDSDSSDGQYFDPPEIVEAEPENCLINKVNGVIHSDSKIEEDEDNESTISPQGEEFVPSDFPTSESTISTLSHTVSEEENLDSALDEQLDKPVTSGWCLNYEPQKNSSRNNNIYNAIDLESLKQNGSTSRSSQEEVSSNDEDSEPKSESYCSHLNIQQELTIECPNTVNCLISPVVEVAVLEIHDSDECETGSQKIELEENLKVNDTKEVTSDLSLLQVQTIVPGNEHDNEEIELERIPRVRRCSSLKTGKTPPGTPGRKKIVRFADVLGLDLADIRTFMDEIPKIPISAYDDLSGVELNLSDTSISSNSSAMDSIHTSHKTVVPLFQQPGGEPSFMDKIRNNQVCLENAVLKDSVTLCISGNVRVRNLDFHKSVHIRYSLDGWKSFADLQATYIEGSCDGFSDKFSFTLYVHTLSIGQKLEFAVRFQCKGCQYWDNNSDVNYVFQCLPTSTNTSYFPIALPDDRNWAGAAFYYDDSVNLQTTVQEYVTRRFVADKETKMSGRMLTAVTVLLFACIFFYIQKIIYFTSS